MKSNEAAKNSRHKRLPSWSIRVIDFIVILKKNKKKQQIICFEFQKKILMYMYVHVHVALTTLCHMHVHELNFI